MNDSASWASPEPSEMCGIYGIVSLDGRAVDGALLDAMGGVTRHRGPDDLGAHVDGPCAIGMTRLSIIDLEGGHQPIANEDETLWLVCNGEIYNFRELRAELEGLGHRFRTRSDSEVLLHAYEQWGDEFVHRLNGMFGFALWDAKERRLLIGRDRLGIKPIYIYRDRTRLIFSTEAKAILEVPGVSRRVDGTALHAYLQLGYVVPAPFSLFDGIRKLPVATLLAIEHGEVSESGYWQIPSAIDTTMSGSRLERAGAGRHRALGPQPDGQRRADRAFLSGGIDSSAVVAFMARETDLPIKTYSIGFEGGSAESLGQRASLRETGCRAVRHRAPRDRGQAGCHRPAAAPALAHGRTHRRQRLPYDLPRLGVRASRRDGDPLRRRGMSFRRLPPLYGQPLRRAIRPPARAGEVRARAVGRMLPSDRHSSALT